MVKWVVITALALLCSRKIAWGNYSPLQMTSEYFSACGRSKSCNNAKFFCGIWLCQKRAAILDLNAARPWEWVRWPMMQCCEMCHWFQQQKISYMWRYCTLKSPREWCLKATKSGFFGSRNNCCGKATRLRSRVILVTYVTSLGPCARSQLNLRFFGCFCCKAWQLCSKNSFRSFSTSCLWCAHVSKTWVMFIAEDLVKKIFIPGCIWHRSFIKTVKCSHSLAKQLFIKVSVARCSH